MDHILVYGDSLDAYQALAVLEKTDALSKTSFAAPEGERSPFVDVMEECAELLGSTALHVHDPRRMTLTSLQNRDGSSKPRALFEVRWAKVQRSLSTSLIS